jgi:hypothetical protein
MSASLTARLARIEHGLVPYLVLAYFVLGAILVTQWALAVTRLGDDVRAPADERSLDLGSAP